MESTAASEVHFDSIVPHFTVPDVIETAEYYRDVLGFQVASFWDGERVHHDRDATAVFGIVERDRVRLHFNRADRQEPRRNRAEGAYDLYLHVTGVDALAEELRGRGANIVEGPEDRVYGQRELIVEDPNGLIVAFGEITTRQS